MVNNKFALISFILFAFVVICSCEEEKKTSIKNLYRAPEGFEEFDSINYFANYKVYSSYPDIINGFAIKAQMIAYIDTINNKLEPTTSFILRHSSGWEKRIQSNNVCLMDVDSFRNFVNSGLQKDTIIDWNYQCDIQDHGDQFNLERIKWKPFVFLDVAFKGYQSLLIEKPSSGMNCRYYDVYGISKDTIRLVRFEPYTSFKTETNEWLMGYGTNLNYVKKEIIVPSLGPGSCDDFGTFINDHYVLDEKNEEFNHFTIQTKYEYYE